MTWRQRTKRKSQKRYIDSRMLILVDRLWREDIDHHIKLTAQKIYEEEQRTYLTRR